MTSAATNFRDVTPLAERFFRTALFFLVLTAVAALAGTGKLDPLTSLGVLAAILAKGARWWRGRGPELSPRQATWLVVGYLFVFPLDLLTYSRIAAANGANPALYAALLATVHFLLFVLLVRLCSAVSDRDAVFLALLSFACVLAAAVLTVDALFLALFFLFLLFGVATFIGYEMRRGARGAAAPAVEERPGQEARLNRALGFASVSVAAGAIVGRRLPLFLLPRYTAGYLSQFNVQPSLMSGFTDNVELGQIGEIKKNPTVVMRVKTRKNTGPSALRWRGVGLTTFDGTRWSTPVRRQETLPPDSDGWIRMRLGEAGLHQHAVLLHYTVLLEPLATDALFVAPHVVSLRGGFFGGNGTDARRSYVFFDSTESLTNPFHTYSAIRYEGFSVIPDLTAALLRAASGEYPAEVWETNLQLPALDPRIQELARRVTANAPTPYDKAVAIERYLQTNFRYTLDLTGKPRGDPLARFLFETRAGHCEYFASAMTVMMRTLGIPTRYVNGFLPGEFNDVGGDYIVRESDAHSWVEVYFPGYGWLTFDPTPAAPETPKGLFNRVAAYLDWMQLTWNEWVIGYDFAHQISLAQNVQRGRRQWTERARDFAERWNRRAKNWVASLARSRGLTRGALPAALVLFLAALNVGWLRRLAARVRLEWEGRRGAGAKTDPKFASLLYQDLLRVLAWRGWKRLPAQTPLEFAVAIGQPGVAAAVLEFTEEYSRARFGDAPCDAARLRSLLEKIRASLRQT